MTARDRIAFTTAHHDHEGHRRTVETEIDVAWSSPRTRVLLVARGEVAVRDGAVEWVPPERAPEGTLVFLGTADEVAHFAVVLREPDDGREWAGLRAIGPTLTKDEASLVVQAVALAEWHRRNRRCPRCGEALVATSAGHVLTCPACGAEQFPRTDPAVIMLVTDDENGRALLGRHPQWPPGRYSTLAGFVEPGESLEQAVAREVAEETGVAVSDARYFASQPWPFPQSLMVGFFASATSTEIDVDGVEIEHARWFTREEMLAEATAGTLVLPGAISISRALIEEWYGGPLPGHW